VPIKQPIVGKYCFSHESGIHTQGVLSNPWTYEPYPPELVGNSRSLSVGKQSGKNVIRYKILQLTGVCPSEEMVLAAVEQVKAVYAGGRRKTLEDKEF
jgi:isopropylmalate/homocitrate/citramalate synthase